MPEEKGYSYNSSGTNSQGNHYCSRDYGNGSNSYHYSNRSASYTHPKLLVHNLLV
ncbi:uncharacterized protein BDV14DRAFT_173848 [Aspergillus stella-maris]|uniref:uncharacterized protein n=1 Tax=Aspergillus stella-maris TaxID=1810926 RepID=UPI003CCE49D3